MASDVRAALVELMAQPSQLNSRDAAVKKLAEMQLKGRYLQVKRPQPRDERRWRCVPLAIDACGFRMCGADRGADVRICT